MFRGAVYFEDWGHPGFRCSGDSTKRSLCCAALLIFSQNMFDSLVKPRLLYEFDRGVVKDLNGIDPFALKLSISNFLRRL